MTRRTRIALASCLLVIAVGSGLLWLLVDTAIGLRVALQGLVLRVPGATLAIAEARGSLRRGFTLGDVSISVPSGVLTLRDVRMQLDLPALRAGELAITQATVQEADWQPSGKAAWPAQLPSAPNLHGALVVHDLRAATVRIEQAGGPPLTLDALAFALRAPPAPEPWHYDVSARLFGNEVTSSGEWSALAPGMFTGELHWRRELGALGALQGSGRISARERSLSLVQEIVAPLRVNVNATATLPAQGGPFAPATFVIRVGEPDAAHAKAEGAFDLQTFTLDLRGEWAALAAAGFESPRGKFTLQGAPANWTGEVQFDWQGMRGVPGAATATLRGEGAAVRVPRFEARGKFGALRGDGEWALQDGAPRWRAAAVAQGVDPAVVWPDWPGKLDFELNLTASKQGLAAGIGQLHGRLRGHAIEGEGNIAQDSDGALSAQGRFRAGRAHLDLRGQRARDAAFEWSLDVPSLAEIWPGAAGRLNSTGRWQGTRDAPVTQGSLEAHGLVLPRARAAQLTARWDLAPAAMQRTQTLQLEAHEIEFAGQRIAALGARLDGTPAAHQVALTASESGRTLSLAATGHYRVGDGWHGQVADAMWRDALLPAPLQLEAPVPMHWHAQGFELSPFCLRGAGRLCASGTQTTNGDWTARAVLEAFRLAGAYPFELSGALQANGRGSLLTRWTGDVHGTPLPVATARGWLPLTSAQAHFETKADTHVLQGLVTLAEPASIPVEVAFAMPVARADLRHWPAWPLAGQVNASVPSLAPWVSSSEEVAEVDGRAELALRLGGTPVAPTLGGKAVLHVPHAHFTRLGVAVSELDLTLATAPDSRLGLSGGFLLGEGHADVDGSLALAADGVHGEIRVKGERLQLIDLPEANAVASGTVSLGLAPGQGRLQGDITVPKASLLLRERAAGTRRSDDVRVVGREEARARRQRLELDLAVALGDSVSLTAGGFSGKLAGTFKLAGDAFEAPRATGKLGIKDGEFRQWGETLTLRDSQLVFEDQPLTDPTLDARAERIVGATTAGLRVTGRLRNPNAQLYSKPGMSDVDVLSYLVAGQPLSTASSTDARSLLGAAASLGLRGSGLLSQQITSTFGLDTLQVGSSTNGLGPALDVGKYLSPSFYVGYGMGLLDRASTFRLRYLLGRRWSIEAETGTRSGADLLYSIDR